MANFDSHIDFSILDHLSPAERARLIPLMKENIAEAGQNIPKSEPPKSVFVLISGELSLRGRPDTSKEYGRVVPGRSMEMRALFMESKSWEFEWRAERHSSFVSLPWIEVKASLQKEPQVYEYLRRMTVSPELQRLKRDLKMFGCNPEEIREIILSLKPGGVDFIKEMKSGEKYFVVISQGNLNLVANIEGREIKYSRLQSGDHYLFESNTKTARAVLSENGQVWTLAGADWKKLKSQKAFDFFISLHGGATGKNLSLIKSLEDTQPASELPRVQNLNLKPPFRLRNYFFPLSVNLAPEPDGSWAKEASLTVLANALGHTLSLDFVRSQFGGVISRDPLASIDTVARRLGFETTLRDIDNINDAIQFLPAIALYRGRPYVILQMNRTSVAVADTALGEVRWINRLKFSASGGDSILIFGKKRSRGVSLASSYPFRYLNIYKGSLYSVFLLILAGGIAFFFNLTVPMLNQVIFERLIQQGNTEMAFLILGAYVTCKVLAAAVTWIESSISIRLKWVLDAKFQSAFLQHVFRLPQRFFDSHERGDILARMDELAPVSSFFSRQLVGLAMQVTSLICCSVVLWLYHPQLLYSVLAFLPGVWLAIIWMPKKIRDLNIRLSQLQSQERRLIVETFDRLEVVKTYNALRSERWKIESTEIKSIRAGTILARYESGFDALKTILHECMKLAVLFVGVKLFVNDRISLGKVVSTPFLVERIAVPLWALLQLFSEWPRVSASLNRLDPIFSCAADLITKDSKEPVPLQNVKGKINFENVTFEYGPTGRQVLKDISFEIKPGEVVAITGYSGCGKSTIVQLMNRLREPTEGKIFIDDIDIANQPLSQIRKTVGVATQARSLFRGTIQDNITMQDPSAALKDVERASRIADSHNFVSRLPAGYATQLEVGGAGVSEGQAQKLLLARIIYQAPNIFVLDESTAHLDPISEELVIDEFLKAHRGHTVILVTHHVNLLTKADRVLYISNQRISEIGTHHELIRNKGAYCDFFCRQTCVNL